MSRSTPHPHTPTSRDSWTHTGRPNGPWGHSAPQPEAWTQGVIQDRSHYLQDKEAGLSAQYSGNHATTVDHTNQDDRSTQIEEFDRMRMISHHNQSPPLDSWANHRQVYEERVREHDEESVEIDEGNVTLEERAAMLNELHKDISSTRMQQLLNKAIVTVESMTNGTTVRPGDIQFKDAVIKYLTSLIGIYRQARDNKRISRSSTPMSQIAADPREIIKPFPSKGKMRDTYDNNRNTDTGTSSSRIPESRRTNDHNDPYDLQPATPAQRRTNLNNIKRHPTSPGIIMGNNFRPQAMSSVTTSPNHNHSALPRNVTMRGNRESHEGRISRAYRKEDRVALQRIREKDLAEENRSLVDDQRIRFDCGRIVDLDSQEQIKEGIYNRCDEQTMFGLNDRTISGKHVPSFTSNTLHTKQEPAIELSPRFWERQFSMPPAVHLPSVMPGVMESQEIRKSVMTEKIRGILHKFLARRLNPPDGAKPLKVEIKNVTKYTGESGLYHIFENCLIDTCANFQLLQLGGSDCDEEQVILLKDYLDGEAFKWHRRHVLSPSSKKLDWTFEEIIMTLYERFVHESVSSEARNALYTLRYNPTMGLQSLNDAMVEQQQNMAVPMDNYNFTQTFINAIPSEMRKRLIEEMGLIPDVHSAEQFLAVGKTLEKAHRNYQNAERQLEIQVRPLQGRSGTFNQPFRSRVPNARPDRGAYPRGIPGNTANAPANRSMEQGDQRRGEKAADAVNTRKNNNPQPYSGRTGNLVTKPRGEAKPGVNPTYNKRKNVGQCYTCNSPDHFSAQCPQRNKDQIRAAHSIHNDDGDEEIISNLTGDEYDEMRDNEPSQQEVIDDSDDRSIINLEVEEDDWDQGEQTYPDSIQAGTILEVCNNTWDNSNNLSVVEFEVDYDSNNDEAEDNDDTNSSLPTVMTTKDISFAAVTVIEPNEPRISGAKPPRIKIVSLNSTKKIIDRPDIPIEDKFCLATYVPLGKSQAWTLWDSGSTTTGITPSYAEIAGITVNPLSKTYTLQLGTVGSRSTIKYGAFVKPDLPGIKTQIYADVANLDDYDMIIGTPTMRSNKVILDFKTNQV